MYENFEDCSRKRSREEADRQRLANDTTPEWSILKGFASDFAGRVLLGCKFQWVPDFSRGVEFLVLNHAAAMFSHTEINGITTDCRVRFDRRSPGPGKIYTEDRSGVSPKEWSLFPSIEDAAFVWFVPELGEMHSSINLADEIAKELGEHNKRYERQYGHWPAA